MRFLILLLFPLLSFAAAANANDEPYDAWVAQFKADALAKGIRQETIDEAFATSVAPIDEIIELDRKQPEGRLTRAKYLSNTVTDSRIDQGVQLIEENKALLDEVSKKYGVPTRFIVALWGMETNFGENTGGFDVIDALATLAYDGRRSDYFRGELMNTLRIMQEEHIPAEALQGSWAGAMGQCQFMPTSFLEFAVDHDRDGQRNIWDSLPDVFASIANYLHSSGWKEEEGWGFEVQIPDGLDPALIDIKQARTLSQWRASGVHGYDEGWRDDAELSLARVGEGEDAAYYLVSSNYKVVLKWNRSRFFATAVGLLSDSYR